MGFKIIIISYYSVSTHYVVGTMLSVLYVILIFSAILKGRSPC